MNLKAKIEEILESYLNGDYPEGFIQEASEEIILKVNVELKENFEAGFSRGIKEGAKGVFGNGGY